ncbi:hypothetical protein BDW42DRAFT_180850 [Aspergillus taichungensis]|uniref:Uncharacterized protein n=1 Tax=Aspergillus taichungensis TaxID=482145 RepID=A0A2J5HER4_9EURO|nr:hypothetical protein BDW42DRAFT_180850 [Aspergillus taichungensis]
MKFSLALVSLGLCIAPAIAQSIGQVHIITENDAWDESPLSGECYTFGNSNVPVKEIDIKEETPHVRCIFFAEGDCQGASLTLKDGDHKFRRRFYAGSMKCLA